MEVGIVYRQPLLEQVEYAVLFHQPVITLQQLALPVRRIVLLQLGQLRLLGMLQKAPEQLFIKGVLGVKIGGQAQLEALIADQVVSRRLLDLSIGPIGNATRCLDGF